MAPLALLLPLLALVRPLQGAAVMSVDLGTEWMKVAVVSPGVPMEIALNPESKRKTNVAVSIVDGERKFGADAINVCVKKPDKCYAYLVDLLGKAVDHPLVQAYRERFPQYTIEADPVRGTVVFVHDSDTKYSVEELLGMVLAHAKAQAEAFTEQTVKDCVITAPVYFNQAERLALVAAAQLGGLTVLQLMNNPLAVALNYGMFRRKEINGTVKHLMLYDMGASATTATVIGFQIVKTKDRGFAETHPQAQVLGVGYDRTLGGAELRFRVREYLADKFNAMGKTKTDVRTVPRAMGKLLKEAERVKLVLSANSECFAQIENVMEDIDFKEPVNRDKLLELGADLLPRVVGPVKAALATADMSMDQIDQVILVGGGTRVPRVQELLQEFVGQELGKSLNTDESAAMGAVYRAADLSTGFKVKKFLTKDAVIFPIDVDFTRALEAEEGSAEPGVKRVRRTLFGRMNPFPQKKIMTFNKHQADFTFHVNYAELEYLGAEVANLGSPNITSVLVKGVKEALEKNAGENVETKGVKAHFTLDDSGLLAVSHVESTFERTVSPEEQEAEEGEEAAEDAIDWSKLGDTISNYFGKGDANEGEGDTEKEKAAKDFIKETLEKDKKDKKKDKKDDKKKDKKDDKPKEPKKPKIETVKTDLETEAAREDVAQLDGATFEASRAKLAALDQADHHRMEKETALNELQSFSFDLGDKMEQEEHVAASTEGEREAVLAEVGRVSEWLEEEAGLLTPLEDFTSRIKLLKDLAAPIFARVREHRERPEMLENLRQSLNHSNTFLEKSREHIIPEPKPREEAGEDSKEETDAKQEKQEVKIGDEGLFKEKELDQLAKKIVEVEKWRDDKLAEQEATPLSEMPKLTVSMINSKIGDMESEVQYLIRKAKMKKAELERARLKAEADAKKAEEDRKKAERKAKKKKAKEANGTAAGEETEEKVEEAEAPTEAPPAGEAEPTNEPTEEKPESNTEDAEAPAAAGEDESAKEEEAQEHLEL